MLFLRLFGLVGLTFFPESPWLLLRSAHRRSGGAARTSYVVPQLELEKAFFR